MRFEHKIILAMLVISALLSYVDHIVMDYRGWVKASTVDDYVACMHFNKPGANCIDVSPDGKSWELYECSNAKDSYEKAETYCLEYARDNVHWSPFPLFKSATFTL
jgi:hypothetical protein